MTGLELANPAWTVSVHNRPLLKAHKPLPRRRDYIDSLAYVTTLPLDSKPNVRRPPNVPQNVIEVPSTKFSSLNLPPTPPAGTGEIPPESVEREYDNKSLGTRRSRNGMSTPKAPSSPPTPEITPPRNDATLQVRRPFLGTQPSMSSRAESFKTAREDFSSDDEGLGGWVSPINGYTHEATRQPSSISLALHSSSDIGGAIQQYSPEHGENGPLDHSGSVTENALIISSAGSSTVNNMARDVKSQNTLQADYNLPSPPDSSHLEEPPSETTADIRRSENVSNHTNTQDDPGSNQGFSQAIKRIPSDDTMALKKRVESWRYSGISTTSTVEAIVVDTVMPKSQKLRHSKKNASLRSASSPIPQSQRTSWNSALSQDSHRLVRKPVKITNENRLSLGSEISQPMSPPVSNRSFTLPSQINQPVEIIPVIVIPQRTSSLKGSGPSSRRQSISNSQDSRPTRSEESPISGKVLHSRRRTVSETGHDPSDTVTRGRDRYYPPSVPTRTSSLSAPTSRNNSRASSMTSETLRMKRMAAEEDVHKTLARMESERSNHSTEKDPEDVPEQPDIVTQPPEVTTEDTHLRPPSATYTPFSQYSGLTSSSQGAAEIHEATAISYFAHNNHSLQVIEPKMVTESTTPQKRRFNTVTPETPTKPNIPDIVMDSPLKNPREPPMPPALKIIPPTPACLTPSEEADKQLGDSSVSRKSTLTRRLGSVRRALSARRSDGIRPIFIRSLNTAKARNRKQEQDLDNNLHPFWRPRSFWDDYSDYESDEEPNDEDIVISNSLGMPQSRVIFDGPLSLVRRISDRNRSIAHKASLNSLRRARTLSSGNFFHVLSKKSIRLQILQFHNVHERLLRARQRREERKREARRAELRKSIGHNVIARGDSRFPISPPQTRDGLPPSTT
ncbi:hypothetical protein UCRPC4_g05225 [Phaeomoniella chlamydospora]|uniref:Uncharacterized protein n=1 Tax=Phaeomoniella chlamydospora TaxID=158046 RepID=A0A0G2E4S8_PHACM|nr:hypothetical protein UCRPC4_g05225 [Phaeomoniella chlamydospora]